MNELSELGYRVFTGIFGPDHVRQMRDQVMAHSDKMPCTRATPSSRHLAGFHRFEYLAGLHESIVGNTRLTDVMGEIYDGDPFAPIGLSDITVNRSQHWHTDLLRGKYAGHLTEDMCWGARSGGCYKVLIYLQDGRSLRVRPASHRTAISLSSDAEAVPDNAGNIHAVAVKAGDVVVMDIRLIHRGSTEEEMADVKVSEPKILISTVFGQVDSPLTAAMQTGNAARMAEWDNRHLG